MAYSVVIPSKNADNLKACVAAVRACEPSLPPEKIICIDDGLAERVPEITYLAGVKPFIFARNVNIGIQAAGSDDVILLNDDALLETPGGFGALECAASVNTQSGLISAATNVAGNPEQFRRNVGVRHISDAAFVCVYIPRRTINQVGLLDERYCLDYGVEDKDYCEACKRMRLKISVYDFCFVDHSKLRSTFRGDPKAPARFERNLGLFRQKWGHVQ